MTLFLWLVADFVLERTFRLYSVECQAFWDDQRLKDESALMVTLLLFKIVKGLNGAFLSTVSCTGPVVPVLSATSIQLFSRVHMDDAVFYTGSVILLFCNN